MADELSAAFAPIEEAWTRRHARDFVDRLYRYHIELNRLSDNRQVEFFHRRPYIRWVLRNMRSVAGNE